MSRDGLFRVTYNRNGKKVSSIIHARDEQSASRSIKGNNIKILHVKKMGMEDIFDIGGFGEAMTKKMTMESFQKKKRSKIEEERFREETLNVPHKVEPSVDSKC